MPIPSPRGGKLSGVMAAKFFFLFFPRSLPSIAFLTGEKKKGHRFERDGLWSCLDFFFSHLETITTDGQRWNPLRANCCFPDRLNAISLFRKA